MADTTRNSGEQHHTHSLNRDVEQLSLFRREEIEMARNKHSLAKLIGRCAMYVSDSDSLDTHLTRGKGAHDDTHALHHYSRIKAFVHVRLDWKPALDDYGPLQACAFAGMRRPLGRMHAGVR